MCGKGKRDIDNNSTSFGLKKFMKLFSNVLKVATVIFI